MGSGNETKSAVRASERGHAKEAWLGDTDRVGQKMTHPLWRPGYGPERVGHFLPNTVRIAKPWPRSLARTAEETWSLSRRGLPLAYFLLYPRNHIYVCLLNLNRYCLTTMAV